MSSAIPPIRLDIPAQDAWVVRRLGTLLARRLALGQDDVHIRHAQLRLLFGLQRLPAVIPGLIVSLAADFVQVTLSAEAFEFVSFSEDGHTEFRLCFFESGSFCMLWASCLEGEERRAFTEARLQDFELALEDGARLVIEDHSSGAEVDIPPISEYLEYCAEEFKQEPNPREHASS